jgi:hypothetical protein
MVTFANGNEPGCGEMTTYSDLIGRLSELLPVIAKLVLTTE